MKWICAPLALALLVTTPALAGQPRPTEADVKYGTHERHVLDFWKVESDKPAPLIVYIHGGGFVGGDKSRIRGSIQPFLDAKVAFASINYRFRKHAPIMEILKDGALAIQFMRSRCREWNIDPRRIGVYGTSAGAIMSLWVGMHNDVGDRRSKDPVGRYTSRVQVVGLLATPFGIEPLCLGYASRDDPPVWQYSRYAFDKENIHHPDNAVKVFDACRRAGIETVMLLKNPKKDLEKHRFDGDADKSMREFFFKHLKVETKKEEEK
jgi:hypothetical protein